MHQTKNQQHIPVLLAEVLHYLDPKKGESYLDLTAGYGGHAEAVMERTLAPEKAVLIDRDQQAISSLQERFGSRKARILHKDFLASSQMLRSKGEKFDMILADLGVSSLHLNTASRGFSFMQDGPLDMRMDIRQSLTADNIVNSYDESNLAQIIYDYGEEVRAKTIARAIISSRPVISTKQLATIVAGVLPKRYTKDNKIHPATRTFQAIRIAVNSELEQLQIGLPLWIDMLAPGGRMVIISFHSLEDRIAKQALAACSGNQYDAELKLLTKRPITSRPEELVFNPRARSAKLRAAVKIKNT